MSQSYEPLKKVLSGLLEDVKYMSQCSVISAAKIESKVETLDLISVNNVTDELEELLDRLYKNIVAFRETFKSSIESFNNKSKNNGLCLARSGDTPDSDTHVDNKGCDDTECGINEKNDIDADSDDTIPYDETELLSKLEESSKNRDSVSIEQQLNEISGSNFSFPFDDDNEAKLEDKPLSENDFFTSQDHRKNQMENQILLDLLQSRFSSSTGEGDEEPTQSKPVLEKSPEEMEKEEEVSLALKILEHEFNMDVSDDSVISWSSDEKCMSSSNEMSHVEGNAEKPNEDSEENDQNQSAKLVVEMPQRMDELNDMEIERLCNLHNVNKRKCINQLSKYKRKRRKRIRALSSSSSQSSEGDTNDSITSNLEVSQEELDCDDIEKDKALLADDLVALLDHNNKSCDSDSTDVEKQDSDKDKKKKKKATAVESVAEDDTGELRESDENTATPETNEPSKWRNLVNSMPRLWSSSDDSLEDFDEEKSSRKKKASDTDKKKKPLSNDQLHYIWSSSEDSSCEELNDGKKKKKRRKKRGSKKSGESSELDTDDNSNPIIETINNTDAVQLISDSDSGSESDDVTFVSEGVRDAALDSKGRKKIRELLDDDALEELTQKAKAEEEQRIRRLEERSKTVDSVHSENDAFVLDVDVASGKSLVTVDKKLVQMLKPHQQEGIQFMWDVCYESLEMIKSNQGAGCILAHCMGLGKTLQVITLIHTLFTHEATNTKHVLVISPLSTVNNWKSEFKKTFARLEKPPKIPLYFIIKADVAEKLKMVRKWRGTGGVLVMGYETFQIITNLEKMVKITKELKNEAMEALVDPGPDLIVCDEGHMLKNDKTLKTKAVMKVRTKRRIVLTGTPLQNNLKEYYFMVQFVKPNLLGTYREYMNRFATPITNGQFHDSNPRDIKLMKQRTHVLTKLLRKTIQRVEPKVLSTYLPEIIDYTIFIKLTPLQQKMYEKYIEMIKTRDSFMTAVWFDSFRTTNFCNLHPYTLHLHSLRPHAKKKLKKGVPVPEAEEDDNVVTANWFKDLFPEDISTNVEYSTKLKVILDIINESVRNNEKLLIFVQHLAELDLIERFIKLRFLSWNGNHDYFRMDGETTVEMRDTLCRQFNSSASAKVLLLTHKVGGLGLNLTGANRVIMVGSNHNPSYDTQSMYRVYRFGQSKKCYIYRLLSKGTMEEKVYRRCVIKLAMSGTVVDKYHFDRHYKAHELSEMYQYDFKEFEERPIPAVPTDMLLATLLHNSSDIYTYHLHNTLLENRPEEELTDEDKKLAWDEFHKISEPAPALGDVASAAPIVFTSTLANANSKRPYNVVSSKPQPQQSNVYAVNSMFNRFGQYCGPKKVSNIVRNPASAQTDAPLTTARPIGTNPPDNGKKIKKVVIKPPVDTVTKSLQNFAQALANRQSSGTPKGNAVEEPEFNYTLNRIV